MMVSIVIIILIERNPILHEEQGRCNILDDLENLGCQRLIVAHNVWNLASVESRGKHVCEDGFLQAVIDFASHDLQLQDRWPPGHVAENLPKDGCYVVTREGFCPLAAIKLTGLPADAPFDWVGRGTKHSSALLVAWGLRRSAHAVIVGSESGAVHGLVASSSPREPLAIYRTELQ